MKKSTLLLIFLTTLFFSSKSQTLNCNAFCVLTITIDTAHNELDVKILNGDSSQINYPIIQVVDANGDTVANKNGVFYYFAQLAGDTVTHTIPTTLDSIPSGFTCTVYIKDGSTDSTCSISYPSPCTAGITESFSKNTISIYPNPANDIVNIDLGKTNNEQAIINLFDSTGKLVKTYSTARNQLIINREGLISGIYFVSVVVGNKRLTSKLILE